MCECGVGGRRWLRESNAVVRESDAVVVLLRSRCREGRCGGKVRYCCDAARGC